MSDAPAGMNARITRLFTEEQGKVAAAVTEAFRLGYQQARAHALNAAHEIVMAEIRRGPLFQGKSRAAGRVHDAVRDALTRHAP